MLSALLPWRQRGRRHDTLCGTKSLRQAVIRLTLSLKESVVASGLESGWLGLTDCGHECLLYADVLRADVSRTAESGIRCSALRQRNPKRVTDCVLVHRPLSVSE
eukprot:7391529-Prymnesium_polylepis.2